MNAKKSSQTRRGFLKAAALTAASLSLPQNGSAEPGLVKRKNFQETRFVELAVATICMDGFGDRNFEPAFSLIPQLPFRNVEFNCWYPRNLTPRGIESIQTRSAQIGVKPVCIQGSSFGASGNIVKDVAHKLWCMEAARQLGCRRVKFTGARRGTEGGLDAVISVIQELAPAAEQMGMLLLVENHANNNLETIEDYERIFEAVDSPNVGLCMDNAHFDGANVDLLEVVERFHSRILHIDLKDTERKGIHKVVPYGEGVTDNHGVVQKMLAHGYSGYLLIEMAPPIQSETLQQDLTRAYRLFEKYQAAL